ncbi:SAV_915 family protein [Antrihabitans cavernicola]|uniref:SseB protein N-terminal domain-containing protein n=1 Tax=Antrihabitans cavernicola TaxID=2495913 RepID=A0A5A7SH95_9NOCA|nr:SAV_915 family protein [Spelaeibacter cavernicola]KAA0024522.1 hypothetical protein FOY51_00725 [Spelaeibacter cavernicola]
MQVESWLEPTFGARPRASERADRREQSGQRLDGLPDFVVVPAHPAIDKPGGAIEIELFTTRSGTEVIAVAFSDVRLLVERLGDAQPWIGLASINFQRSVIRAGIAGIVLDPVDNLLRKRWSDSAVRSLSEALNG